MKNVVYLFLLMVSFQINAQRQNHKMSLDKPSMHGMLLFGNDNIYASHLPMFHSTHDYQILIELELSKADKIKYLLDLKQNPNYSTYTIEPEIFVLPDMINDPKPFKVNLYRGHFERGGIEILKSIAVKIVNVIYFKKFNLDEPKRKVSNFILFGNEKEQFLAHEISNRPDFEQIIEIKTNLKAILKTNDFALITVNHSENNPIGISGNEIQVNENKFILLKQLYLEFDDLKK